ncbi:MAG: hypothetical protein HKN23_04580 [Verrucomicrobiales bacterium]|nr:hypothetical protein [Verrucomicrobiales bacterium]
MKAKLLSFNVDPQFGNTLDALLLADFRQVPLKVLARYMGKAETFSFFESHEVDAEDNG